MDCLDPVSSLLAFYANETLDREDRLRVEAHLSDCDECRALLDLARAAREMGGGDFDPSGHVQAQLLAEYAGEPEALEAETRARVASHLQACEICASVVPVLRSMPGDGREKRLATSVRPAASRLRDLLNATLLRPVPAVAWLALALVVFIWIARGDGTGRIAPDKAVVLPAAIHVQGDVAMRGEEIASAPMRLEAIRGAPLLLALHTDLDPEETAPGSAPLRLVVRRRSEVLWSVTVTPESIPTNGILEMTLLSDRFPHEVPLELSLERDAAGSQAPLFRKTILLAAPAE